MSFGTSVGDIILLIQLAHKNYRNCKEAGGEYIEIAREVRSLHSVLRTVRDEAERKDSLIFNAGPEKTKELTEIADGCKGVLEGIDALLTKYKGLAPDSAEVGKATKFWQKLRFGTEIEDLEKLRWKIITYTSTLAVLVDSINLKATERVGDVAGRIESRMETGFADISDRLERFEDMRKAVLFIATRARASQRYQAMESVLSLSTYADDDKEVWRQFRSQLVSLGFKSDSLDRHMEVLKAYMMKLDQTGLLDEAVEQSDAATQSWCGNASFRTTNLSLLGTVEMAEQLSEAQAEKIDSEEMSMSHIATPQNPTNLKSPIVDRRRGDEAIAPSTMPGNPTTRRRRIPRIKVEQSDIPKVSEVSRTPDTSSPATTPVEKDEEQSSSPSDTDPEPRAEIDSGIDVSNPRQPRPYAESYYSISEAATSQSTLLRDNHQFTKPSSPSKESRPQNTNRPTSWSGPDTRKPASRKQRPSSQIDDGSDSESTVGKRTSKERLGTDKRSQIGSREKVDDWLRPPAQQTRARASSSPTRHKPIAKSMEELLSGEGKISTRPSSTSRSGKNVRFDSRPAEEIFAQFMKEGDKAEDRQSSPNSRSTRPSDFSRGRSTSDSKAGTEQNTYYRRTRRSRSPKTFVNGEKVSSSQSQLAAKAALIAGAVEAFRMRNEEGSWSGEKAKRIMSAAIGAAGVDALASDGRREGEWGSGPPRSETERGRPRTTFADQRKPRSGFGHDSDAEESVRNDGGPGIRDRNPDDNKSRKTSTGSSLFAAVLGGLAASQLLKDRDRMRIRRGRERTAGGFVASESEYDSDSEFASDSESDSDTENSPPDGKRRSSRPQRQQQQNQPPPQYQPQQQQQPPPQQAPGK
ncbi:hypothetical protein BKA64DRAFT_57319 [Cadophora sp. MPI-SDFR-AT-0126]|nr:hypothetical protein BKA64DRAFT_57319 [Leotiomycetes sp. MPI-SDFR-AT-0126]